MQMMETDGSSASYGTFGCGEPVVALHATASSGRQWESLGSSMSHRFQFIAPDLFGHGQSPRWHGLHSFSLCDDMEIAYAVMRRCSRPVHLIGHSYGGAVALRLALEHPERFRSLTLIEPVSIHLLRFGDARDRRLFADLDQLAADMTRSVLTGHQHDAMRRFVDYWNGEGAWWRMREDRRSELSARSLTTLLHFAAISSDLTPLAAYRRIKLPTLLIEGRQTRAVATRIIDKLASQLGDTSRVVIENAGHMLPVTHSELVNAAIGGHVMEYAEGERSTFQSVRASAA